MSMHPGGCAATPVPTYVLGGYEAGLAVVGSLGRAGIPVVAVVSSPRETARHSRYTTACVTAPDPADATADYVATLLRLADEHGAGLVVPTTDESLEAVAAHHDALSARHTVACATDGVAQGFLDKRVTSDIAERVGVEAPRTASPSSPGELEVLLERLRFPCLVKPAESYRYNRAFGVKMKRVHTPGRAGHRGLRERRLRPPGGVRPYLSRNAFATFDARDPQPILARVRDRGLD